MSLQDPIYGLVIAQAYDLCAHLFFVPLSAENGILSIDSTRRLLYEKQIHQRITPSLIAKPFMNYIVGTAKIVRVSFEHCTVLIVAKNHLHIQVVSSSCVMLTPSGHRVILEDFREDVFSTQNLRSVNGLLEGLSSNVNLLHTCKHTGNDLQGHAAIVIRTALDKTKVATCLLVLSSFALFVGIGLAVAFPQAGIGGIISTATIALACLLQACVAWCHH